MLLNHGSRHFSRSIECPYFQNLLYVRHVGIFGLSSQAVKIFMLCWLSVFWRNYQGMIQTVEAPFSAYLYSIFRGQLDIDLMPCVHDKTLLVY